MTKWDIPFRNNTHRYTIWMKGNFRATQPFDAALVDAEELYDYEKDDQETKNLVNEVAYKKVKNNLKAQAIAFFKTQEVN